MSRVTIHHKRIDCDVCGNRDIGEPDIISVNAIDCDVCYECEEHFKQVVSSSPQLH